MVSIPNVASQEDNRRLYSVVLWVVIPLFMIFLSIYVPWYFYTEGVPWYIPMNEIEWLPDWKVRLYFASLFVLVYLMGIWKISRIQTEDPQYT